MMTKTVTEIAADLEALICALADIGGSSDVDARRKSRRLYNEMRLKYPDDARLTAEPITVKDPYRPQNTADMKNERFNQVPDFDVLEDTQARVDPARPDYIEIWDGGGGNVARLWIPQARLLRDWLNKALPDEPTRDPRGFPLAKPGIPIEARCAACLLPMVTTDDEHFIHDCDCMRGSALNRGGE